MDKLNDLMTYESAKRPINELPGLMGADSIFNKYSVFALSSVNLTSLTGSTMSSDAPGWSVDRLFDIDPTVGLDSLYPESTDSLYEGITNPTAKMIIDHAREQNDSNLFGPMPYSWSDFLYCKYYGEIPNNRLITLRRYPLPTYDSGVAVNQKPMPPISQAVTWFSDEAGNKLSELLKFTFGLAWKEIEAKVQDVNGNEKSFGAGAQ